MMLTPAQVDALGYLRDEYLKEWPPEDSDDATARDLAYFDALMGVLNGTLKDRNEAHDYVVNDLASPR